MKVEGFWARGAAVSAVLTAMLAVGCGTTGLGTVPEPVIELYDQGEPSGMIELEIDRDGTLVEAEADVPVADLPEKVLAAAMEKAPGARVTGAEREIRGDGRAWEVKLRHEGRSWEFVIDGKGNILEIEKELRRSEAPSAVLEAADREVPGGTFKSVELIEKKKGDDEYHVKKAVDGASYKIVLTADGELVRKVREARAEIEIPLAE